MARLEVRQMASGWTKADEKRFQALLKQRRRAAEAELNKVRPRPEAIEGFADNLIEDYHTIDAWKQFMAWEHPDVVRETAEDLKELYS
jgi:hypothetical protein